MARRMAITNVLGGWKALYGPSGDVRRDLSNKVGAIAWSFQGSLDAIQPILLMGRGMLVIYTDSPSVSSIPEFYIADRNPHKEQAAMAGNSSQAGVAMIIVSPGQLRAGTSSIALSPSHADGHGHDVTLARTRAQSVAKSSYSRHSRARGHSIAARDPAPAIE